MALKAGRKGVFPFHNKQAGQTTQAGVDSQGRVWYKEGGGSEYVLPVATPTTLGGVKPVAATEDMTANVGVTSEGLLKAPAGTEYTLPIATPSTLGGVKPVAATAAMTADVGVTAEGLLKCAAGGGSSSALTLLYEQTSPPYTLRPSSVTLNQQATNFKYLLFVLSEQYNTVKSVPPPFLMPVTDVATDTVYPNLWYKGNDTPANPDALYFNLIRAKVNSSNRAIIEFTYISNRKITLSVGEGVTVANGENFPYFFKAIYGLK